MRFGHVFASLVILVFSNFALPSDILDEARSVSSVSIKSQKGRYLEAGDSPIRFMADPDFSDVEPPRGVSQKSASIPVFVVPGAIDWFLLFRVLFGKWFYPSTSHNS